MTKRKKIVGLVLLGLIIFAIVYFAERFFSVEIDSGTSGAMAARGIIERVSKIAVVPSNEEPVVATVNDLRPLAGKPFFKNAKVGYKLLVYREAGRGILYDPIKNKIVEMATISLGNLPE